MTVSENVKGTIYLAIMVTIIAAIAKMVLLFL